MLSSLDNPHSEARSLPCSTEGICVFGIQELALERTALASMLLTGLYKAPEDAMRIALEQIKFLYLFDLVAVCLQTAFAPR